MCRHRRTSVLAVLCLASALGGTLPSHAQDSRKEARNEIRDRHWGSGLEPDAYLDELVRIGTMPDEQSEKGRGSLLRNTRWECIGPLAIGVTPGNNWHGRMRTIRWYRNPVSGTIETYLGSSSGGLWFGNFAGLVRVWTPLGDNLPNPAVGAFLIDSLDPNSIWVGTGDKNRYAGAGLFHTSDRGATWARVALGENDVKPRAITGLEYGSSMSTMYLTSDRGFWRSTDAGETWSPSGPRSLGRLTIERLSVDPTRRTTLYIAGPDNIGFHRSTNSGETFTEINTGVRSIMAQSALIAVSPSSPNVVYGALSNHVGNVGMLYKSTNRGDRWDSLPAPPEYLHSGQAFNDHAIAISPVDPDRVYVGGVGLMRTVDGGSTWQMRAAGHSDVTDIAYPPIGSGSLIVLNDGGIYIYNEATDVASNGAEGFLPGAPLQAYSLDDAWSNSKVMVSGLQDNGTVVTDEAGTNNRLWWIAGGCDGGNTIGIHPTNPSQIFFNSWCGPSYRLRSDDMGRSQVQLNQDLGEFFYVPLRLNKLGSNWLFTVTKTNLMYSTNAGDTWLRATTASRDFDTAANERVRTMMVNHHLDGPTVAYVLFEHRGDIGLTVRLFRGIGGSMTMTDRRVDRDNRNGLSSIAADRWSANVAYAMTVRPRADQLAALGQAKIYRTTDGGLAWSNITGNMPNVVTSDIVASPIDPNTMYAATELGVFRTRDGGVLWERFQHGLPIVAANSLSYIRGAGFDTLRVATFGRGYWSRVLDGSDPIVLINSRLNSALLRDVAVVGRAGRAVDFDSIVVVGVAGTIGTSSDGGRSFRFAEFPSKPIFRSVASSDRTRVTVVGDAGTIIHSASAGREWAQVESGVSVTLRGIAFSGPTGLIIGDDGAILGSSNGGGSWKRVHDEKQGILIGLSMPRPSTAWVVGGKPDPQTGIVQPIMLRTSDSGQTWVPWQTPPAIFSAIFMIDDISGYAGGVDGVVYATTDGGSSWLAKPTGLKASITDLIVAGGKSIEATTLDGQIMRSDDGGASWKAEEGVSAPGALYALTEGTRDVIAVGDSIVVLVRTKADVADTSSSPEYIELFPAGADATTSTLAVAIESIVPNPSSGATTIRFSVQSSARVSIAIHTLLGETVAVIAEERVPAGTHSATWDANDAGGHPVPPGAYIVRVTAGGISSVGRISIVR